MNMAWQQQKMLNFCEEKGIHVSASFPLGANGAFWGSLAVMESPILKNIATAKGKRIAQVALRWVYEQGASPIVKSFNTERARQNLGIFDWELKEDYLALIKKISQNRAYLGENFVSPKGPYKSIQEIWDGEDEA